MTLAAGCVAVFAAISPLIAAADEDRSCPSGAVIELGGVSNHGRGRGQRCNGDDVSFAGASGQFDSDTDDDALSLDPTFDARPLVLPDTGGGPVDDQP
jgi:hypothetical protein